MDPAAAAPPRPHFVRGERSVNMEYTSAEDASDRGSPASGNGARGGGDRVARRRRLPDTLGRSVLFTVFSESDGKGSGRQRRAAAGRSGDWRRGDSGPGSGGTRTGRPLSSSVSRPVALVRARRWPRRLRLRECGVAMPAVAAPATRQTCSAAAGTVGTDGGGTSPTWDCMLLMSPGGHRNDLSSPLLQWAGLLGF